MIAGYELGEVLGRGAHGYVLRAVQLSLGRAVAIKRLNPGAPADPIRREAAALAAIGHPHVVPILDVVADGDGVALVLPLAAGGSLAERLASQGRIAAAEVATIAVKLSGALTAAHRLGVLHLDVKPSNVLLAADGEPWLADFGVARWVGEAGEAVGSAGFVAPEALAGAPEVRSDVFSLARLCLTSVQPSGPAELLAVLERACDPDPARRPASAAIFADELRPFAQPGVALSPVAELQAPEQERTRTFGPRPPAPAVTSATRPGRRVATIGAVVVAIAAVLWAIRGRRRSRASPLPGRANVAGQAPRPATRIG